MRILKAILMAPVRVIVFFIQLVLTLGVVIFGAAGGIVTKAGEIVGGRLILGSLFEDVPWGCCVWSNSCGNYKAGRRGNPCN